MVATNGRTVTVFGGTGFLGLPHRSASALSRICRPEMFPSPLLTRTQGELMQIDTMSSPELPGFVEIGISPHCVQCKPSPEQSLLDVVIEMELVGMGAQPDG